jgi:hypothetical protein
MQIPKWNDEKVNKEIENRIQDIANFWKNSPSCPKIKREVEKHWDNLLNEWIADKSLPLYIRKKQSEEILFGQPIKHISGRIIVLTDNYPALWSYISAFEGEKPSIKDIKQKIKDDQIPIAMGIKKRDPRVKFKCTMKRDPNWRYCHIEELGTKKRGHVSEITIEKIEKHFKLFLAPSNMFVLPKAWGDLGECDTFIKNMRIQ